MCAAGALRGSPASMTITDRRWRPSWSAAASPAAEPPTTATSQCRSTVRGAWSLMAPTIRSHPVYARILARFARTSGEAMVDNEIEQVVRTRLRSLRNTLGLSLDDLATRTNLSPSTISRVETGKRTISLDILLPLASALQVDLDALLDVRSDDDVVIRPAPSTSGKRTTWMLSRPTGSTIAIKMRLEPTRRKTEQRVHPGHDWFFVLEGRVRLSLGEREILVETGEAAEFGTMTPHAFTAIDGPAELIMIFDRDGQRAHVHHETDGHPTM